MSCFFLLFFFVPSTSNQQILRGFSPLRCLMALFAALWKSMIFHFSHKGVSKALNDPPRAPQRRPNDHHRNTNDAPEALQWTLQGNECIPNGRPKASQGIPRAPKGYRRQAKWAHTPESACSKILDGMLSAGPVQSVQQFNKSILHIYTSAFTISVFYPVKQKRRSHNSLAFKYIIYNIVVASLFLLYWVVITPIPVHFQWNVGLHHATYRANIWRDIAMAADLVTQRRKSRGWQSRAKSRSICTASFRANT